MDNQKREKSILPAILLILQVLLIIVVISLIVLNSRSDEIGATDYERQSATTIENLDTQLPDAPSGYLGLIERDLARVIRLNSADFDVNSSKAVIREGTLRTQTFQSVGGTYFSLIVDIPNLQQSYQIYAHTPADDTASEVASYTTQYVLCLDDKTERIYPDFQCQDGYPSTVRSSIANIHLKYFDFNYFTAFVDSNDFGLININPVNFNTDDATKAQYIQTVKDAVDSLGISPDIFTYRVLQLSDLNYYIPPEYL